MIPYSVVYPNMEDKKGTDRVELPNNLQLFYEKTDNIWKWRHKKYSYSPFPEKEKIVVALLVWAKRIKKHTSIKILFWYAPVFWSFCYLGYFFLKNIKKQLKSIFDFASVITYTSWS